MTGAAKNIDQLIEVVIGKEGGYSDHPADRGGPTRWGVTEQVARAYGFGGDMRVFPRAVAVSIYRQRYWSDPRFDDVAAVLPRLGAELFDAGINMGPAVASGFLQRALNALNGSATLYPDLIVDGRIGQMTIAALRSFLERRASTGESVLLKAVWGLRTARYFEITEARPANEAFLFGWLDKRIGSF